MKYLLSIVLVVSLSCANIRAQEVSVEKSIWGAQILMLPLSVYNESKLTNEIALRSELSWGFSWSGGGYYDSSGRWEVIPYLVVEPRYYYNLNRRLEKGKRIDGNSGNYLSLYTCIQPGIGFKSDNARIDPGVFVIPMYGLKRNIGKRFNFELAYGIGYGWIYEEYTYFNGETHRETDSGVLLNFRLAIGYMFKKG